MSSKFLLVSSCCLLAYSQAYSTSVHSAFGTHGRSRKAMYDSALHACHNGSVAAAAKMLGCPDYITSICQAVIDLYKDESVQAAAGRLECPLDVKLICQAVIDRYNKPKVFSHQEVFDLPQVAKVDCETDAQSGTRAELAAMLVNERLETILISDARLLLLDLSEGNYGLKLGDELSRLNLFSLFQAAEVTLNIGKSIRLASIDAMAESITSLIISGVHKDFLDLRGCVGLRYIKLSNISGVNGVDVSGLTALNTLELEECADLAALNASGCIELSEIRGSAELIGLVRLNIGDSKLSDLDLVNSVKLQFLSIPGNMTNLRLPRLTDISVTCIGQYPTNVTIPGTAMLPSK